MMLIKVIDNYALRVYKLIGSKFDVCSVGLDNKVPLKKEGRGGTP